MKLELELPESAIVELSTIARRYHSTPQGVAAALLIDALGLGEAAVEQTLAPCKVCGLLATRAEVCNGCWWEAA